MVLDSERQRQQLLACINDTTITGTFRQVAEAFPVINELVNAVTIATIAEKPAAVPVPEVLDNVQ